MPELISGNIRELVYRLLAHPQLSIREHAVKAYTLYIARCDFQVISIIIIVIIIITRDDWTHGRLFLCGWHHRAVTINYAVTTVDCCCALHTYFAQCVKGKR